MDKSNIGDKVTNESFGIGTITSGPWWNGPERADNRSFNVKFIGFTHPMLMHEASLELVVPPEKWESVDVPGREIRFKTIGSNWIRQLGISELQVKVR